MSGASGDTEVDGSGLPFEHYRNMVMRGANKLSERTDDGESKYPAADAVSRMLKSMEGFCIRSRMLIVIRAPGSIPCRYFSHEFD